MGATSELLPSTEPFYIEFKLPIEVSSGDKYAFSLLHSFFGALTDHA
jgi:hypothetical protein